MRQLVKRRSKHSRTRSNAGWPSTTVAAHVTAVPPVSQPAAETLAISQVSDIVDTNIDLVLNGFGFRFFCNNLDDVSLQVQTPTGWEWCGAIKHLDAEPHLVLNRTRVGARTLDSSWSHARTLLERGVDHMHVHGARHVQ